MSESVNACDKLSFYLEK